MDGAWRVFDKRYKTGSDSTDHLTFALRHETIDLLVLKRVLKALPAGEIEAFIKQTPTGAVARRLWFFYELLTGARLDLEDAQNVALLIGGLFDKSEAAATGLYELLVNAIEHGNFGIGFELKAELLAAGTWEEEILRRASLPENAGKVATVTLKRVENALEIEIADQGPGFNWRPFLLIEPSRATRSNGRGIAKANLLAFDSLAYKAPGNVVVIKGGIIGTNPAD